MISASDRMPSGRYGRCSFTISASGATDDVGLSSASAAMASKRRYGARRHDFTSNTPTAIHPAAARSTSGSAHERYTG